jgi:hypothetical protein
MRAGGGLVRATSVADRSCVNLWTRVMFPTIKRES